MMKTKYTPEQLQKARAYAAKINFTVWQQMNYFLTGQCVPFFSPER